MLCSTKAIREENHKLFFLKADHRSLREINLKVLFSDRMINNVENINIERDNTLALIEQRETK